MLVRFLVAIALGVWLGGLTFHAAVVVPIGESVLGSVQEMGFVTQKVTVVLNWIGVGALAIALVHVLRRPAPRPFLLTTWGVQAATLVALFALHPVLDAMLAAPTRDALDAARFYRTHQVYLWITALQWLAGVLHVAALVRPRAPDQPAIRDSILA